MNRPLRSVRHATVIDPVDGSVTENQAIRIEGERIVGVETDDGRVVSGDELDASGTFAIPGLIDCHVHALSVTRDLQSLLTGSLTYLGVAAGRLLEHMLARGFTTVRDCGGADWGLAAAIRDGHILGPELLYCGHALSQTGGQGDARSPGETAAAVNPLAPNISRLVDGPSDVRRAVRDEARKGATFVKLLAEVHDPGGWRAELSSLEVRTAVEEAALWRLPVTAHAYTAERVQTLIDDGVACIEHGSHLDAATAARMAAAYVHLVPTLGAYRSYAQNEGDRSIPLPMQKWAQSVVDQGLQAIEHASRAGVTIGFGTDLTVAHERQNEEFVLRASVQSNLDVLRSATVNAASILGVTHDRGRIAPHLRADIVLCSADPLNDITVLAVPETNFHGVVRAGRLNTVNR